jgi:hypothetical protein
MTAKQREGMAARRERLLREREARRLRQLPEPEKPRKERPTNWALVAWFRQLPFRHKLVLQQAWEVSHKLKAGDGKGGEG